MLKNLFALGDLQMGLLYIFRRCFFQPLLVQFRLRVFIQPKIQLRLYSVLSVLLERHIRHGSTQSKPVQEEVRQVFDQNRILWLGKFAMEK